MATFLPPTSPDDTRVLISVAPTAAATDDNCGSLTRDLLLTCGLLALGQFALVTSVFMLTGLLPAIAADYEVSTAAAGQVIGVFSLSYAVSEPFLAVATARLSRRPLLMGVLLVFCAANLLAAVSPGFGWLLASVCSPLRRMVSMPRREPRLRPPSLPPAVEEPSWPS